LADGSDADVAVMRTIDALIPAAGRSRRMGTHKLLLTIGGQTIVRRLVESLRPVVRDVWILARGDDEPLQKELETIGRVRAVIAESEPPEMRDSVERLLDAIEQTDHDRPEGWMLIPADHPVVRANVLALLAAAFDSNPEAIHLPTHGGRRGHPAVFPWSTVTAVRALPRGRGIDAMVRGGAALVVEHETDEPSVLWDLDTPEDYERLMQELGETP
jgi:molybdenum cofactor cytidylyltransferase